MGIAHGRAIVPFYPWFRSSRLASPTRMTLNCGHCSDCFVCHLMRAGPYPPNTFFVLARTFYWTMEPHDCCGSNEPCTDFCKLKLTERWHRATSPRLPRHHLVNKRLVKGRLKRLKCAYKTPEIAWNGYRWGSERLWTNWGQLVLVTDDCHGSVGAGVEQSHHCAMFDRIWTRHQ